MISLVKDTIDQQDLNELIDWLKTSPRLTKGKVTIELEEKWAAWLGTKYSIFVNSGSSALLLMVYSLIESKRVSLGDKIVIPSLCWATDLAPVIQFGLNPILCDCNLENLSVDLDSLEKIFIEEKPKALMLVSVLGFAPDMENIVALCERYNVILLEDVCESTGTRYKDKKLGTFGLMSAFSCYFGHHFSTIEGGFINTNDYETYELLKMLRSHGWNREVNTAYKDEVLEGGEFHNSYRFFVPGFNLRSTDLQAFIGLKQIDKLDKTVTMRNENYLFYKNNIKNRHWMPEDDNNFVSNFAFPIIHPERDKIVLELQNNEVEVRPLICGSMGTQPMYTKRYGTLKLKNSSVVDKYGFYIPNHPKLTKKELTKVVDIINRFTE
tara:strand:- start:145 stop:1287 length:1143 start_codon:yes stop_codon:yes gene_type:complete